MNLLASVLNRVIASSLGQVLLGSMLAANKRLCFELLWMARNDQRMRLASLEGKPWDDQIDRRHTQTMKRIVARYGWPGEGLVGQMGAQAAWLLVQHADHDREFQKQCHRLLVAAVKIKDAPAQHLAYLTDRLCVGEGVPQIYGTQLEYLIDDPEHMDERRVSAGLSSLAEYLASSSEMLERVQKHGKN